MTVAEALQHTGTEWGSSRFAEYRRCRRAHALRYIDGVIPRARGPHDEVWEGEDASALAVGNLVHSCLAYAQAGGDWREVITAAEDGLGGPQLADIAVTYEAGRLIDAYFAHWGDENAGWPEGVNVTEIEALYSMQIPGLPDSAPPYTARLDCLLVYPGGEIVICDHKTRASAPSGYAKTAPHEGKAARWRRGMASRPQFVGAAFLVKEKLGLDYVPKILYNGIIKQRVPQFIRPLLTIPEAWVDEWLAVQREEICRGVDDRLPNLSACSPDIGMLCWAFEHCKGTDESREKYFQIRVPGPKAQP